MTRLINIMNVALYFERGSGEFNSKEQSVYEVLRFHTHNIEFIYGIESALKIILQAKIQGVVNSKGNGVHQVSIDAVSAVSAVCQTLLSFETLMTRCIMRMKMSLLLGPYYELHIEQEDAKSDGSQELAVSLHLRRGDAISAVNGERRRDSGIEEGEDDDIA